MAFFHGGLTHYGGIFFFGSSGIAGGFFIEDSCRVGAPIRVGRGESVTRGDRRRREQEARKLVAAAHPPPANRRREDALGRPTRERLLGSGSGRVETTSLGGAPQGGR